MQIFFTLLVSQLKRTQFSCEDKDKVLYLWIVCSQPRGCRMSGTICQAILQPALHHVIVVQPRVSAHHLRLGWAKQNYVFIKEKKNTFLIFQTQLRLQDLTRMWISREWKKYECCPCPKLFLRSDLLWSLIKLFCI